MYDECFMRACTSVRGISNTGYLKAQFICQLHAKYIKTLATEIIISFLIRLRDAQHYKFKGYQCQNN